ncbi:MAG: endonuclease/exonuclease/phosphatase family protein [Bacteroidaceae bacterium]|nr:endonuclease/exonuclease/phosphatase family protein [Bacteroidaceae bacterium]
MRPFFSFLAIMLLAIPLFQPSRQGGSKARRPLKVMEWNVENLFDTLDDEGAHDEEFLPQGERRWNSYRLWKKMKEMARVIAAIGEKGGIPDLIGLCEVENDTVMTMFTRRSILRELNYEYVMTNGIDERGIDVALLYQPARFRLINSWSKRVHSAEKGFRPTRDILCVKGLVFTDEGTDTLHVLVTHLPSRAGGEEGDQNRKLAAQTLMAVVDSIKDANNDAHILLMGDFNTTARDRMFKNCPLRITDNPKSEGNYSYQGFWEWIDHILVSENIVTYGPAQPVKFPWLLEMNKTWGNKMPLRTFRGPSYHGGISDHLPLVLMMKLK